MTFYLNLRSDLKKLTDSDLHAYGEVILKTLDDAKIVRSLSNSAIRGPVRHPAAYRAINRLFGHSVTLTGLAVVDLSIYEAMAVESVRNGPVERWLQSKDPQNVNLMTCELADVMDEITRRIKQRRIAA